MSNYIDGMGDKFKMLQTDKKLRPTSKDKYYGFIRSMKDKVDAISVCIYFNTNI